MRQRDRPAGSGHGRVSSSGSGTPQGNDHSGVRNPAAEIPAFPKTM
jgi:hypothetical protein